MVGYFIAYFSFFPWFHKHCRVRERDPDALQPEARLYWLLWGKYVLLSRFIFNYIDLFIVAPLLVIGLFGFAWTSLGPPHVHWIAPMIFSTLIAIANVRIFTTFPKQVPMLTPYSMLSTWLRSTTWSPVMGHILHQQQEATHLPETSFLVLLPCIRHLVSLPFTNNYETA